MAKDDRYSRFEYRRLIAWDERIRREWPLLERVLGSAPSRRILDLGSGTGEHSRFLAAKGFDVTGIDASPSMIEKSAAEKPEGNVRFILGDMREADRLVQGPFGAAICLGNALPHLTDDDSLQQLASALRRVLAPGGPFLLQILNYDRIEAKRERALPINFLPDPDDPAASIVFVRLMEMRPKGQVIFMPATLKLRTDNDPPLELVSSQRVEIRGWREAEIGRALRQNGFSSIETFGAFDGKPFEAAESRDVIIVAR